MVTTVIIVMVNDTQGSWHINLASLFPGILKHLMLVWKEFFAELKLLLMFSAFCAYKPSILVGYQSYYYTRSGQVDGMSYS